MVNETIAGLKKNLKEVPEKFLSISADKLSRFPAPGKWSKKQILGHLCDSALNNYSRFIRAQFENEPMDIRRYEQDEWVEKNGYQSKTADELVLLWSALNSQILNIIALIPVDKMNVKCDIGNNDIKTLQWLIDDYLSHMNHHLQQIFDEK